MRDRTTRERLFDDYRTLTALVVVATLLLAAYVYHPTPLVQYGAWLVVFSVWMAWFVAKAAEWVSNADF